MPVVVLPRWAGALAAVASLTVAGLATGPAGTTPAAAAAQLTASGPSASPSGGTTPSGVASPAPSSGVSGQNRMVERHDAQFGAYWKSYDFKPNNTKSDLAQFPLGPVFKDHPFEKLAFEHDGGELIFNLPNGFD